MTHTNEQFEHVLEEALTLAAAGKSRAEIIALFPEYATELSEMLALASDTQLHFIDQRARTSFRDVIKKISMSHISEKKSVLDFLFARPLVFSIATLVLAIGINTTLHKPLIQELSVTSQAGMSADTEGLSVPSLGKAGVANQESSRTYLYDQPNPTISDLREYVKTAYRATIKTLDVAELNQRLLITIRGYKGRVDSYNSNERSAHIEFVIPKSELEKFREDITALAGRRFITQFENGQNMLWKKVGIEEETNSLQKLKTETEQNRAAIVKKYSSIIASLNHRIAATQQKINQAAEQDRAIYIAEKTSLEKQRSQQQSAYNAELTNVDQQLKDIANMFESIKKRDQQFGEDLETVSGSITLQKINWFDVVTTYIPTGWFIAGAILAAYFFWRNRRQRTS